MQRKPFTDYVFEHNVDGSGMASSYVRALDLLSEMLVTEPFEFTDCVDIWNVTSVTRLRALRDFVLKEQKRKSSLWRIDGMPASYLENGYCSAALSKLIEFLPLHLHSVKVLGVLEGHKGDDSDLVDRLSVEPPIEDLASVLALPSEGKDALRMEKSRIGQYAFRRMILHIYGNRCCITGIDIPMVNRASHIIAWSQCKETRMNPRNGLCLSATYDAAFDQHLISLDDEFRLIVSKNITKRYTSNSVKQHFLDREGQTIELPNKYQPLQEFLDHHRKAGKF